MAARRRIDPAAGAQALRQWAQEQDESQDASANDAEGGAGAVSPADRAAQSVRPSRTSATQVRATTKSLSPVPARTVVGRASSRG